MTSAQRYDYGYDPEGQAWPARLLRQLPPAGSVLELGPGPGAMTKVLVERGYSVTVVENDPQALAALQGLGVDIVAADLNSPDWSRDLHGRRFDAVLACDVLEHLLAPATVVQALAPLVQPAGRLIVSLPNVAYAGVMATLRLGYFDYADKGLLDRTHLRFFTRRSVQRLLLEHGWAPQYWDANRVPLEQSEFAWAWRALGEAQRVGLMSGWPDYDVYQWMAVATPLADTAVAELRHVHAQSEAVRAQLDELLLRYEQEHASLLEHQKAFAEAKQIIERQQGEVTQLQQAHEKAVNALQETQVVLQQEALAQAELRQQLEQQNQQLRLLSTPRWRRWLNRVQRRWQGPS